MNPVFCFTQGENLRVGYMKAPHQTCFPLKLGAVLEKEKGGWLVSQTSEWKMSFVILVSVGRRLADMALWFQSPLKWN